MTRPSAPASRSDVLYAIAYAGAIGSAVIATLFLLLDTVAGRPLETPILMGSVLFLGDLPAAGGPLRLDLAAGYSIIHFLMFTSVGALFALAAERLRDLSSLPGILIVGLFLTLSAGMLILDALVAPDLVGAIGLAPLAIGNLSASLAMTGFYLRALEIGGLWLKVPSTLIGDAD